MGEVGGGGSCDLRGVHGPVAAVASGDGEHYYAPSSSLVFFPRRDTFASESIPEGRGSAPLSQEGKVELTEESRLSQP